MSSGTLSSSARVIVLCKILKTSDWLTIILL